MHQPHLILCSSSRAQNSEFLAPVLPLLKDQLTNVKKVLFVPFAGVSMTYDEYTAKVAEALSDSSIEVTGLHTFSSPKQAIAEAEAILVGGGNTFHLLHTLQHLDLIKPMQDAVKGGVPYVGWSAGANIAGLTIRTTNDMPIIEPETFAALALVPFQLNPHYTDGHPANFHGETRDQRLAEFMQLNPQTEIVGIREGAALVLRDNRLTLHGESGGVLFKGGHKQALADQADLSKLINS